MPSTRNLVLVTGWTSDPDGSSLRALLDESGIEALVELPPAPPGLVPPTIQENPTWARPFELCPSLLGAAKRDEVDPSKLSTAIEVTDVASEGIRGETMQITGVLRGGPRGTMQTLSGQRVDLWLSPRGRGGDQALLLGRTVTRPDGSFLGQVELPDDLPLMEYEVYVSTPGDSRYAPSVSD